MKNKNVFIGMLLINLISMMSGFIRDSSIAISLGTSNISDIFMFIINIPTVLFSAIGWVIISTFVPTYIKIMANEDSKELNKFSNTFMKCITIFCVIIVLIFTVFNGVSIKILAPGFVGENLALTKKLFIIIIPSLIFLGVSSCMGAILNANKKMIWIPILGIPINIMCIIGILFLYPRYGIEVATFAVLLGSVLQVIVLAYPLSKTKFKLTMDFDLKNENIKQILISIGPMLIGVMAQQINMMFSGAITSTLSSGSLTSYNLAIKIINAVYNSIILIGISYIFPYLAHDFTNGKFDSYRKKISRAINLIILFLIPVSILIFVLNKNIIALLYGYGKFDEDAIVLTGKILIFSSLGIVFMGIREMLYRSYYASNNTKIPVNNSILSIVVNIILSIILARFMGVMGISVAGSVSVIISTAAIYIRFKFDNNESLISRIEIVKYVAITLISYFLIKVIEGVIQVKASVIFTILATSILGSAVYLVLLYLFRVNIKEYLKIF